jgi:hypothetical protein
MDLADSCSGGQCTSLMTPRVHSVTLELLKKFFIQAGGVFPFFVPRICSFRDNCLLPRSKTANLSSEVYMKLFTINNIRKPSPR